MYTRIVNPLLSQSFFLFGARGTGKSTLLKKLLGGDCALWIDLLQDDEFRKFSLKPELLEERVLAAPKSFDWVVIDEVQRVPALLNHVHRLIESKATRFALTGSSARKLKRGSANLLAGRAFLNMLHPLTHRELDSDFNLEHCLQWGSLPKVFQFKTDIEKSEYLNTYATTYLKEEIREEQLIRKVEPFLRFLEVAAQSSSTVINHSKIGRDAGVDSKAVERYFEILVDTLVGILLPPYHRSIRKRQTQQSKFYFFDTGIRRSLDQSLGVPLSASGYSLGRLFESFIVLECLRLNDYMRKQFRFSYIRTKDDLEIDLVIERSGASPVLMEIKYSDNVDTTNFSRLESFRKAFGACEFWIVSREESARRFGSLEILPWRDALGRLF